MGMGEVGGKGKKGLSTVAKFDYMNWQKAEPSEPRTPAAHTYRMLRAFSKLEVASVIEPCPATAPAQPEALGVLPKL